jgi:methyltransferase
MTVARLGAFELIVALTAIQRLAELVHSRRNLARLAPGSTNADSRANFSMLVVLQTLWLAGSAFEPARRGDTAAWTWFVLGLVLFALGQALRVWCIVTLGRWWNARARIDPALEVVTSGPYRWVRHPNYLGVLLEAVGLPLAGGALWTLALLAPAHALVLWRRIHGEDALLFSVPGYRAAMGTKGALLPRFGRR